MNSLRDLQSQMLNTTKRIKFTFDEQDCNKTFFTIIDEMRIQYDEKKVDLKKLSGLINNQVMFFFLNNKTNFEIKNDLLNWFFNEIENIDLADKSNRKVVFFVFVLCKNFSKKTILKRNYEILKKSLEIAEKEEKKLFQIDMKLEEIFPNLYLTHFYSNQYQNEAKKAVLKIKDFDFLYDFALKHIESFIYVTLSELLIKIFINREVNSEKLKNLLKDEIGNNLKFYENKFNDIHICLHLINTQIFQHEQIFSIWDNKKFNYDFSELSVRNSFYECIIDYNDENEYVKFGKIYCDSSKNMSIEEGFLIAHTSAEVKKDFKKIINIMKIYESFIQTNRDFELLLLMVEKMDGNFLAEFIIHFNELVSIKFDNNMEKQFDIVLKKNIENMSNIEKIYFIDCIKRHEINIETIQGFFMAYPFLKENLNQFNWNESKTVFKIRLFIEINNYVSKKEKTDLVFNLQNVCIKDMYDLIKDTIYWGDYFYISYRKNMNSCILSIILNGKKYRFNFFDFPTDENMKLLNLDANYCKNDGSALWYSFYCILKNTEQIDDYENKFKMYKSIFTSILDFSRKHVSKSGYLNFISEILMSLVSYFRENQPMFSQKLFKFFLKDENSKYYEEILKINFPFLQIVIEEIKSETGIVNEIMNIWKNFELEIEKSLIWKTKMKENIEMRKEFLYFVLGKVLSENQHTLHYCDICSNFRIAKDMITVVPCGQIFCRHCVFNHLKITQKKSLKKCLICRCDLQSQVCVNTIRKDSNELFEFFQNMISNDDIIARISCKTNPISVTDISNMLEI